MDKDYFIKLTLALYRVTDLFPKEEPLKFSLRTKADDILTEAVLVLQDNPVILDQRRKKQIVEKMIENIEILESYFELGRNQNWVDKRNFSVLEDEYNKIKQELARHRVDFLNSLRIGVKTQKPTKLKKQQPLVSEFSQDGPREKRCKVILETLQNKDKAQVWEFQKTFPKLSKRTLRRDFEYLLERGFVQRIGDNNSTYYKLART